MRIEVGYGLEGLITDALAGRIINDVLVPGLQSGDPDGAVSQAVENLIAAISGTGASVNPPEAEPKAPGELTWMQKIIIGIMILGLFAAAGHQSIAGDIPAVFDPLRRPRRRRGRRRFFGRRRSFRRRRRFRVLVGGDNHGNFEPA